MPGRQGSNPQKQNEEPLVPDTVLVTKRAGLSAAKNIRVGSVEALTLCGSVFSCGGCEWDVEEGVALEHPAADAFGEFFDLFFDVGEEGIRAPASDEHNCVDLLSGEVHHHGEGGSD